MNFKGNFLQYYSPFLSAIPHKWRTMLKQECFLPSTEYVPLAIEKLTWKTIYNTLLKHQHLPPPTADKRLIEYGFIFQERQNIYSLSFRVTNEVKLSVFQYKIVHNILYTNTILHKMKKKKQPDCPYYHGSAQTPLQIFVECSISKSFWNKFHKVVQHYMWRKHCFGAERNYIWCFKLHIVLFNSQSLNHD